MGSVLRVSRRDGGVEYQPADPSEATFTEAWLQDVLRRHPDVLPVDEFGPIFHPLVPIGKEMPTTAGSVDNVFISHAGYIVIVETKLWRNPEARREAVVQIIDYATALSRLSYDDLDKLVRDYLRKYEMRDLSLQAWVEERIDLVDAGFQRRVARSLRLGRFLLLIVTDHARPSLVDMLARMSGNPMLSMDIGIVELRPFMRKDAPEEGVLLVPYVAGRTEIVERTVVEVTVAGVPEAQVTVRQERHQDEAASGRRRAPLTSEAAFWELMHDQAPHAEAVAHRLIDGLRDQGIELGLRESSIMVEAIVPGTEVALPLFYLNSSGRLASWPPTIARRVQAAGLPEGFADQYVASIRRLFAAAPGRIEPSQHVNNVDGDALHDLVLSFVKEVESTS